jgi:hypothetical protein
MKRLRPLKRQSLLWAVPAIFIAAATAIGPACRTTPPKPTVAVLIAAGDPVLAFAVEEISALLEPDYALAGEGGDGGADWTLDLAIDAAMPPFAFSVRQVPDGVPGRSRIELRGRDAAGVLNAVHTMLADAGVVFDVMGPLRPARVDLGRLAGVSRFVRPAVERRGIRQHINFAMDISSYPLEEAKAYIRNLARLRMNTITFHSYPGQWYPYALKDGPTLAGNFFYGQLHTLPEDPDLRKTVRNTAEFCIPEIEPYFSRPEEKSRRAMDWLRAVMAEAKRVGLTIHFSMELRESDPERSLAVCRTALASYPLVDGLELITQEDSDKPIPEIGYNVRIASILRDERKAAKAKSLEFAIGVYNTTPEDVKTAFAAMRRIVPSGMHLTVLPAHGARMAVRNLDEIPLLNEDLARTMIYSWVEFDGLMYLQQNPVEGIRRLIDYQRTIANGAPLYGVCWNHWRTAENRTSIGYAARAMVEGSLPAAAFYADTAAALGIGNADAYAAAMAALDEADDDARNNLFNIGFCFGGYWQLKRGLANYGRFEPAKIETSIGLFTAVQDGLKACLPATAAPAGRRYLEFLANRLSCTILHLRAFLKMSELQPLFAEKNPPVLSDADRRRIGAVCDAAIDLEKEYLALHAAMIEDRGGEGTLVSYGDAPLALLLKIREAYAGIGAAAAAAPNSLDAPPAPKK